jgi:hypothetical protein
MGKGNDFWLDDPEWEVLRRKAEKKPIPKKLKYKVANRHRPQAAQRREEPRAQASKEVTDQEVVVNLKLAIPKVKLPDFRKLFRTYKQQIIKIGAVCLVLVIAFGAFKLITGREGATGEEKADTPMGQADFKPLMPLEGFADGGGQKLAKPEVKYDQEKNVLAYVTPYNGSQLTVSQQSLPEQLKLYPGQLEGIARTVNANIPIETQKGKAYIATDDKAKTQVAVFATKEALVFIRSTKILDNDEWKIYINQLNPTENKH